MTIIIMMMINLLNGTKTIKSETLKKASIKEELMPIASHPFKILGSVYVRRSKKKETLKNYGHKHRLFFFSVSHKKILCP